MNARLHCRWLFWGMEDLFRKRPGITHTEVIYLGGVNDNPTYRNQPGHAEGIELTYYPTKTSFEEILDYFTACMTSPPLIGRACFSENFERRHNLYAPPARGVDYRNDLLCGVLLRFILADDCRSVA